MIHTQFTPATELSPGELLQRARVHARRVLQQTQELTRATRNLLARRAWSLRRRLKQRIAEQLLKERTQLRLKYLLELEHKTRLTVAEAHRDCLEVALTVTRDIVGELLATDTTRIAARVLRGLERVAQGRVLSVAVAQGMELGVEASLRASGCIVPVQGASDLTAGTIRLITAHGLMEMPWEDECAELSNRLRSVLETRISATLGKENA